MQLRHPIRTGNRSFTYGIADMSLVYRCLQVLALLVGTCLPGSYTASQPSPLMIMTTWRSGQCPLKRLFSLFPGGALLDLLTDGLLLAEAMRSELPRISLTHTSRLRRAYYMTPDSLS
ncbi:hypothetical protein OE88DRAFT_758396 [Heliocybe sulcata]|uniref:Uncharacterized protein n=1 Tax=Heliocybe sulcata TaxID=5364 RepID=A0A5C3MSY7_9AGAM|nr:hypothetical protein OE88DRAFT_758396 [Heliocybe sulcata]